MTYLHILINSDCGNQQRNPFLRTFHTSKKIDFALESKFLLVFSSFIKTNKSWLCWYLADIKDGNIK